VCRNTILAGQRAPVCRLAANLNYLIGGSRLSNWDDLIQEMAEVIKRENHTFSPDELDIFLAKRNHLDIAEMFRQTVGPHAYFRFLRERYRKDVRPSPLHRAIAKLPAKTIFTTNYDKLLETAFRIGNRIDPAAVIFPEQLNYIEDDEVRIIKLHGDIDHPSTIILTRTDYAGYASKHQEFINLLQSSINGRTMLFLGFGLRDSTITLRGSTTTPGTFMTAPIDRHMPSWQRLTQLTLCWSRFGSAEA
jgi:hypothetical protein